MGTFAKNLRTTMNGQKKIKSALISVFSKENLEPIVRKLDELGVTIYSTGGTQKFIEDLNINVIRVEDLTSYPSILGGRVKTLHPKIFGGILSRRELDSDVAQLDEYEIPEIDLVIVDLYPFEATVSSGASHDDIIEKIDIGGISLIRAAAKNFKDVVIVPSNDQYQSLLDLLNENNGDTDLNARKTFAKAAFNVSSHYDSHIFNYFDEGEMTALKVSESEGQELRYGENPHQKGLFYGDLDSMLEQLHGKALSYNNLLDVDAAVNIMSEFVNDDPTFAILKHNNACGLATRSTVAEAYKDALAGDPTSAFGGILITNTTIDAEAATAIHDLFCEVVIAPDFSIDALEILRGKKNRRLLKQKHWKLPKMISRTCLNGTLVQDRDLITDQTASLELKTSSASTDAQIEDLIFANKIVKHTKSNTIVFAKGKQLISSGTGQTSRIDACHQAIEKAQKFGFDLNSAAMASDAFFPFPDCVELAHKAGVDAVIQPGGSIKDELSIDYCNEHGVAMYFTGNRHFKH